MSHPLYRIEQLRRIEQRAAARLPAGALMQRAGQAAADWITARLRPGGTVLILCGPGNNGGDGYACAAALRSRAINVCCVALTKPSADDARASFETWNAAGGATLDALPAGLVFDVIVDAMLGIGGARPLGGALLAAARWLEQQQQQQRQQQGSEHRARRATVLALDVPSGLDADSGCWLGGVAGVKADATLTFIGDKPGLHTADGCDAAGDVEVAPLGAGAHAEIEAASLNLSSTWDFPALLAPRRKNSHKGDFGNVAVLGGARGMVGAPLLAARAALHMGAGRVYVSCIGAPELVLDPDQPELMFRSFDQIERADVWVVGCGMGTDGPALAALEFALAQDAVLVLDADALNLIAAHRLHERLQRRAAASILTPHPLEAARLTASSTAAVQTDRVATALGLASHTGTIVVLKGAGTVIATAAGQAWINPTGTPALASAGSGDVLAGMAGALASQCRDPLQAALGAVWLHGAAADAHAGDLGLTAAALPPLAVRQWLRLRRAAAR